MKHYKKYIQIDVFTLNVNFFILHNMKTAEGKRSETLEVARAEADRIRKIGQAEAEAIALIGKAQAESMKAKAGSYANFGNAGVSVACFPFPIFSTKDHDFQIPMLYYRTFVLYF